MRPGFAGESSRSRINLGIEQIRQTVQHIACQPSARRDADPARYTLSFYHHGRIRERRERIALQFRIASINTGPYILIHLLNL